jgi:hypothetical protein
MQPVLADPAWSNTRERLLTLACIPELAMVWHFAVSPHPCHFAEVLSDKVWDEEGGEFALYDVSYLHSV